MSRTRTRVLCFKQQISRKVDEKILNAGGTERARFGAAMLVVSIILEAAVAVIAALAAWAGRPYLYGLSFTFAALCALRPRAPATMAGRGTVAVRIVLAGDCHSTSGGVGAVSGAAREVVAYAVIERRSQTMKLALKHAVAAIVLVLGFAAPVVAGALTASISTTCVRVVRFSSHRGGC